MMKFLAFIVAIVIVLTGIITFVKRQASASTTDVINPAALNQKQFDTTALSKKLDAITAEYSNLDIGISVINLSSNQTYNYGEDAGYIGASTTKVITASLFLHMVEQGKYSLNTKVEGKTAGQQIKAMIEQSDNEAWAALNAKVGRDFLQAYADGLGLTYDKTNNSLGTADMATVLQKLYQGQLLNKAHTDLILGSMQKSVRSYIGDSLGSNYTVYHKAGWLDDRLMDAAIVTKGSQAYVLVIFSKTYYGDYDLQAGATMFGDITRAVNAAIH